MDLARSIGVTRIARVTGLDRAGVEVACAVRPGGHVLQISNGKGETREEAAASALSEAAELWCAEHLDAAQLVWGSPAELRVPAISPAELPLSAPALWSERVRLAWRRARDLQGGPELLVPAQAVHCAPRGAPPLGPALLRWSSNGMGAHPFRERALQHALLEAIERDQLARALPHGFTPQAIVYTTGRHTFTATKEINFDGLMFSTMPATMKARRAGRPPWTRSLFRARLAEATEATPEPRTDGRIAEHFRGLRQDGAIGIEPESLARLRRSAARDEMPE